jgi:hypothetical protein
VEADATHRLLIIAGSSIQCVYRLCFAQLCSFWYAHEHLKANTEEVERLYLESHDRSVDKLDERVSMLHGYQHLLLGGSSVYVSTVRTCCKAVAESLVYLLRLQARDDRAERLFPVLTGRKDYYNNDDLLMEFDNPNVQ